jgi:RNA polymerase sigma-70 factor (ECF subfamily)
MSDAKARRVEQHREYLQLLASMQVAPHLAGKIDLSGVVQQTVWEATQAAQPGGEDRQWLAWLRRLLANNLRDEIRKVSAARRDVRREQSLEAALDASSARVEALLVSQASSPSKHAVRGERLNRLAVAMSELPDDQRVAIELHHLQGLPLSVAADQLGRSKEAVASLLYRALKRLKKQLHADEGE